MTGHDPATGKELWRANGFNPDNDPFHRIIASPVVPDEIESGEVLLLHLTMKA